MLESSNRELTSGPPGLAATATIGQLANLVSSKVFHILFFNCEKENTSQVLLQQAVNR